MKSMNKKTKEIIIQAPSEKVFAYMDNISNTGMHMTKSSMAMMGSKLILSQLSENATGLNSKFWWHGKMMGFKMDFTVAVTKWIQGKEKVWETVGKAEMIIMEWYQMHLMVTPVGQNTQVQLSIFYTNPNGLFFKVIACFLAPWYASWCLKNMLNDSKQYLESTTH
jgi:uncharacterized membrane protein